VRVKASSPASTGADNGVNINIVNNDFNLDFTANPSVITNPNRTATFSNNTPNSSAYDFYWYFGDGLFQLDNGLVVTHTYPNNGVFIPSLVAVSAAGCSDNLLDTSKQVTVNVTGINPCGFTASTTPSGNINGCQGGAINISYSSTCQNCSFQWNRNGVPLSGGNTPQYTATQPGFYSISISDSSGCVATSSPVNISFGQPPAIPPSISATGNIGSCSGGVNATLTANGSYASYVWSTGATGTSINITQGGSYVVYGQGIAGCDGTSLPYNVNASAVQPVEICMVTATDDSQYNQIVWNGPTGVNYINNFIIFREDLQQTGVYNQIGSVAYADSSSFVDPTADPNQRSYRYKLAIEDSCGGITLSSTPVRSMYLQIAPYLGTKRLLSWNLYQGQSQNITKYYVYSGNSLQNLNLIDSVNAPSSFYIDNNPVAGPGTKYRIEAALSNTCSIIDRAPRTRNKSNSAGNLAVLGITQSNHSADFDFSILPNPAKDEVYVAFETPFTGLIRIEDLRGRLLKQSMMNEENMHQFRINDLPAGMYLIHIDNANRHFSRKLIKF
jgi:hypothetical protein